MWSVLLVFLSSLDKNLVKGDSVSNALDAKKQSKETFCVKVSSVETHFLYEVSHGTDVVRSMVSAAGKLVNCSITANPEQVASFTHKCRLQRKDDRVERQLHAPYERVDEARHLCQRFTEKLQQSEKPMQQDQVLKRAKRGFTYPGTLWCGAGNMADNYNQLGDFEETDSCCRTHDHCPHVIHAFSSNYGHTNFKWHSICHCNCDNTLKDCLRKVNDTSSRVVGQAFFNVIGVPCFEFAYEEQCVERHWYGLCKRYEKRPIAVLKEAVPYDFGGIDVIDKLTVTPTKKKDSNSSEEQVKSNTTTQSKMSGSQGSSPEEPSLQNVVTAAEDFIKVLATVSTSQSSTNDLEKGDAQSSGKKKKKTKKKKTKKPKGKGRKRKQKAEALVKIEDSAADPLSNTKTDNAIGLSNFFTESQVPEQPGRQSKKMKDPEYELGGKEETSNEVMKDEPAIEEEAVSMTSPSPVPKKTSKKSFLTTTSLYRARTKWLRNKKRKVKPVLSQSSNQSVSEIEATTTASTTTTSKPQPSIVSTTEWQLIVSTTPIEVAKVEKNRSKLKKDREERKKRLKVLSVASSTSVMVNENIGGNLKEASTLITGTPTTPPPQVASQRANLSRVRDSARVTALNTSFSVLKRQRQWSKEKELTKRKRKGPSLVLLNEQLSENNAKYTLPILLPTPTAAMASPVFTPGKIGSTDTQTSRKWQLFTTSIPAVGAKRLMNKKHEKSRKKATSFAVAVDNLMTFTNPPTKPVNLYLTRSDSPTHATSTSANPALSITIEKVKEQFDRKKRRKAVLSTISQQ